MAGPAARALIFLLVVTAACRTAEAQQADADLLVDLSGEWQFQIGDDPAWKLPSADGSDWMTLDVPGSWETQGMPDYDGFGWYRRAFKIPPGAASGDLLLRLGRIDDADEVFLNGTYIGASGGMPPSFYTAYDRTREYPIPDGIVDPHGENLVAIRVFDARLDGGIIDGEVGLVHRPPSSSELIRLDGVWLFRTGDDPAWAEEDVDKEGWTTVTVPGNWEPQGFPDYDGYGWYRKEFFLPLQDQPRPHVLLLGKIDDLDVTYVNGLEVGHTGSVERGTVGGDEWQKKREYDIPVQALRFGDYNVIAVRVYDAMGGGGLHEGPHALYAEDINRTTLQTRLQKLLRRVTGQ